MSWNKNYIYNKLWDNFFFIVYNRDMYIIIYRLSILYFYNRGK